MNAKMLSSRLKDLEESLLSEMFRKNSERLNELIADEFIEIGKSGKIWTKQSVIEALNKESYTEIVITGFNLKLLTENIALVTYTAHHKQKGNPSSKSLRSSIWKMADNKWKIIFHQGTPSD